MLKKYWWCSKTLYLTLDAVLNKEEGYYSFKSVKSGYYYYYDASLTSLCRLSDGQIALYGIKIMNRDGSNLYFEEDRIFYDHNVTEILQITKEEFNNIKMKAC